MRASTEAAQVPTLCRPSSVSLPPPGEGAVMLYCGTHIPTNTDVIVGRPDNYALSPLKCRSASGVCLCRPPAQRG